MTSRACIAAVLSSVCGPAFAVIHPSDNNPSAEDLLAPKPAWVERAQFPAPIGGDAVSDGTEWLLDDTQYYLDGDARQVYERVVLAVANPTGLSDAANWEIPWSPPFARLTIHRILVRRGSEVLSAFDMRRIHIARRETDFWELEVDGQLSALITLDDIPHVAATFDASGLSDDARDALLPSSSREIRVTCMALLPRRARSSAPDAEIDGESITVMRRANAEDALLRLNRDLDVSWSGPGRLGDARHAAEERDAMNQLSIDVQVDDAFPLWLVGADSDERLYRLVGAAVACLILLLIVRVRRRHRADACRAFPRETAFGPWPPSGHGAV